MREEAKRGKDGLPPRERLKPSMIPPKEWEELKGIAAEKGQTVMEYLRQMEKDFPIFTRLWVWNKNHPKEKTAKELREEKKRERKEAKRRAGVDDQDRKERKEVGEILAQERAKKLIEEDLAAGGGAGTLG